MSRRMDRLAEIVASVSRAEGQPRATLAEFRKAERELDKLADGASKDEMAAIRQEAEWLAMAADVVAHSAD